MPSVMWKELTAEDLRGKSAENAIVLLPIASMEQHGPHLPVGVDTYLCEAVCKAGAELAAQSVPCVVAPTLWCGMAEHHMAYGGTFTFDIPTYRAVLLAFLKSIERQGFKRVFIVNGHGGNIAAMNSFLPDFARETSLTIRAATYFDMSNAAIEPFLEDQTQVWHACEVETSLMMVVAGDTVKNDRLKDAHGMLNIDVNKALRGPPARFQSFQKMTPSGVIGDARRASKTKGVKILAACAKGISEVLNDKAVWA